MEQCVIEMSMDSFRRKVPICIVFNLIKTIKYILGGVLKRPGLQSLLGRNYENVNKINNVTNVNDFDHFYKICFDQNMAKNTRRPMTQKSNRKAVQTFGS